MHSDELPFTLYYEINPIVEHFFNSPYFFQRVADPKRNKYGNPKIMQNSDRVWKLTDDGTVTFIKNRHTGLMTDVDMREFALVQYAALCYNPRDD